MIDRILAIVSMLMLIGFVGTVVAYVREPALWVVVGMVLAMAIYDFWRTLRMKANGDQGG